MGILRIRNKRVISLGAVVFLFFAALLGMAEAYWTSIVFSVIAFIFFSIRIIDRESQFVSVSMLFWLFAFLYGISGPLTLLMGGEISFVDSGTLWNNLKYYLLAYSIACIAYIGGEELTISSSLKTIEPTFLKTIDSDVELSRIKKCVVISAVLCTTFEMINILRIGGFGMLFVGKGTYQSLIGDLKLTLPADSMYSVCGIFIGILMGCQKSNSEQKSRLFMLLIAILLAPFIVIRIILGMRLDLISIVLNGTLGYSIFSPVKKISFKIIISVVIIYLFMVVIYANRGIISLLNSDPELFQKRFFDLQRYIDNFNLGGGEFGAPFANFCIFYEKYKTNFDFLWGKTYIIGLAVFIPSFLYLGEKPQQITYLFRDEFFSSWASRSRIAGTGFSSLLEAYWNWGWIGIIFVYFIVGLLLKRFDNNRNKEKNIWATIAYIAIAQGCMTFSRQALGDLVSDYLYILIYSLICYLLSLIKLNNNNLSYNSISIENISK